MDEAAATTWMGAPARKLSPHERDVVRRRAIHHVGQVTIGEFEVEGAACLPWIPAAIKRYAYGHERRAYGGRPLSPPRVRP